MPTTSPHIYSAIYRRRALRLDGGPSRGPGNRRPHLEDDRKLWIVKRRHTPTKGKNQLWSAAWTSFCFLACEVNGSMPCWATLPCPGFFKVLSIILICVVCFLWWKLGWFRMSDVRWKFKLKNVINNRCRCGRQILSNFRIISTYFKRVWKISDVYFPAGAFPNFSTRRISLKKI